MHLSINQKLNIPRPLFQAIIVTFVFILFMSEGRAGETWETYSNVKILLPPN